MPWGKNDNSSYLRWVECFHRQSLWEVEGLHHHDMFPCLAVAAIEANEPHRRMLSQHRGSFQQILQRTCILTPLPTQSLLHKRLHVVSCRFCSPRSLLGCFLASKSPGSLWLLTSSPSRSGYATLGWLERILEKWHCRPKWILPHFWSIGPRRQDDIPSRCLKFLACMVRHQLRLAFDKRPRS